MVVGALIKDPAERVYVHRRSMTRKLLPGTWDIVGGHVEPGETPQQALAREIEEETGWTLRAIESVLAEWEWTTDGETRHELDYLVEVDGDLTIPRLEQGKHDAYDWVDQRNLDMMMVGRSDGDRRLRDIVAKAARSRLTERLLLVPIGPEYAEDFWRVQQDSVVAGGQDFRDEWPLSVVRERVAEWADEWERRGAHRWMAYLRDGGDLVGCGGPGYRTLHGVEHLEIGWSLLTPYRGQGLATELGAAALRFARETLGCRTVLSTTEATNERSQAVMERLGLRQFTTYHEDGRLMVGYRG